MASHPSCNNGEPSEPSSLSHQVYCAARDGYAVTLYTLLADQATPQQKELLEWKTRDIDDQVFPPLVAAARNGHEKAVHCLASKFHGVLDLEVAANVVCADGSVVEAVTALWCAAEAGHLKVVRALVKAGADVHRFTPSHSTALRAACHAGHVDVARFLVEKAGADANVANLYDNTCLMIAAHRGHGNVVRLLLRCGSKVDATAKCGATALHFAAESGHLEAVRVLVEEGNADACSANDHGMTAVLCAADRCRESVVDYLIRRTSPNLKGLAFKSYCIDALELLGASFANDVDNYSVAKSWCYLQCAMRMRLADGECLVLKPESGPVEAYGNRVECCCMEDLEAVRDAPHDLHMEGLAIRERIMGRKNAELLVPIIFRGAIFADACDFKRCIPLWLHALDLRSLMRSRIDRDLLRFTQLFCQIIDCGKRVEFDDFIRVFRTARDGLKCMSDCAGGGGSCCKVDGAEPTSGNCYADEDDCMGILMVLFLYLVAIFTRIRHGFDAEESKDAMRIVHDVVRNMDPKTRRKRTLLHLAVDPATPVDSFHASGALRFPCAATAKLLLELGADPKALDADHDTPLHLIVGYQKIVSDFQTLHGIIGALVAAGAHGDVVNRRGQTPMAKAATGVAQIILKSQQKINLKCLAARTIKRWNIEYCGLVPDDLQVFVDFHGS